jgi:hypothetical protein
MPEEPVKLDDSAGAKPMGEGWTLDAKPCEIRSKSAKRNIWAILSLSLALVGLAGTAVAVYLPDTLPDLVSSTTWEAVIWSFLCLGPIGMILGVVVFILSFWRPISGRWTGLAGGLGGTLLLLWSVWLVPIMTVDPRHEDFVAIGLYSSAVGYQQLCAIAKKYPNVRLEPPAAYSTSVYSISGYITIVGKPPGKEPGLALCATPLKYGGKTRRTFIVRLDDAVVWAKDLGRAQQVEDFPEDPASAGWEMVCDKKGPKYRNGLPALPEETRGRAK